jgi:TonB family protein
MKRGLKGLLSLSVSLSLHVALVGGGALLLLLEVKRAPREELVEVLVEPKLVLPRMALSGPHTETESPAPSPPVSSRLAPGGGEPASRPDQDAPGRGGQTRAEPALNLSDSVDELTLSRDSLNHPSLSQVQRLDTARHRESHDDRRATPNPMELWFVASGDGTLEERRRPARVDPGSGLKTYVPGGRRGTALGAARWLGEGAPAGSVGGAIEGVREQRLGPGARTDYGNVPKLSARVSLARPALPEARAAVPARVPDRPHDTVDSHQAVALRIKSLIQASTLGGVQGPGVGGEQAPGVPAVGGERGENSRSVPSGWGDGPVRDASDPRVSGYFSALKRKVAWRDAFPDHAIAEGLGGHAIIGFTLLPDGSVRDVRVVRASGVEEFDQRLVAAVSRAAPFGALPRVFGDQPISVHFSFDAMNPAVGRDGPGPGGKSRAQLDRERARR